MKELVGGCLQAIGILIAGLFGLCTLIMVISVNSWRAFISGIDTIVGIGLVPLVVGIGLIFAGRALIRNARGDDGRSF